MKICRIMMLVALIGLTGCDGTKQGYTNSSEVAAKILEGEDAALAPYVGDWALKATDIPTIGNVDMNLAIGVEDKKVTGKVKALALSVKLSKIRAEDGKLKFSVNYQNMDIPFVLEKEGDTVLKGVMMDEIQVAGVKK